MSNHFQALSKSIWQAIDDQESLPRNTYIIRYKADHYLIYNPSEHSLSAAKEIIVSAKQLDLLAASAGYLSGLVAWRQSYPSAYVWGADPVSKIFTSRLGLARSGAIGMLHDYLPDWIKIKPVPTSRLGECWVHIDDENEAYLVTSESLMNLPTLADDWASRIRHKLSGLHQGLCISYDFKRKVSLGGFRNWSQTQLKPYDSFTLLPTKGEPLKLRTEDAMRYVNQRFATI
ncbi:hypothetical protein [Salinibius halmophilus]|uniref:hypothetical protein n=1 Tax=Salinibius halmophilus TaxID=1853216 RepID=UPI000E6652DD|nr:hypothetical protein [Salinibius halmophilus]